MEDGHNFQDVQKPKYDCLLFDLDDTLYPYSSGVCQQIAMNIEEYMIQKLGIDADKVAELNVPLYKTYGTTMAGLKAIGYDFEIDEYNSFVHGRLPYDVLLKPDPVLRGILQSLPIRKIIFTNADSNHAISALKILGLEDCFERIISFDTLNPSNNTNPSESKPTTAEVLNICEHLRRHDSDMVLPRTPLVCKPFDDAFECAFKIANIDPQRTLFFDDSIRNLQTAKRLGLHTVAVGTSVRTTGVDHALESIHNMREAFPELWDDEEKHEFVHYKAGIETSVKA
ncbi:hypothetical protein LR48_Vigan238s004000 [Vigna angularis]|uniref:Uncharacterized protein n=2 Tax=Phaseolus angularis TaxID=3914 RepID=A0A0L9T6J3_PHAAN|nr:uncharacterized protein C24B11.05 [Vigna angularis]XP_017406257.1 uncharacterized protein C24B11.05 [Vigna angularis]KAG2397728.1 uncharacterized protein HKW66_Vig0140360 [Vigna angularis]KOM26207.1 hypothetical protein LR48_Vigan238s004000 [Vigna angularis]BAT90736.1 hypothetical protein VIGAN_06201700 [Vigna angularis var. angularis]